MTVTATIQLLEDGRENTILRFVGTIDATPQGNTVLIDPATLTDMGPFAGLKAGNLRVKKVIFAMDDAVSMNLFWDATTPVEFESLEGRDTHDYRDAGGLQNNSGVGRTGKILYAITFNGTAPTTSDFAISLYLGKQT
jgi:hypothetical protein